MDSLNPQQFFHGTRAHIPVGGSVLPSGKTGVEPNHDISDASRVYLETNENEAWKWADSAYGGASETLGRPWVGRVKPTGGADGHGVGEHTAKSAQVVERHDIMPGRQGTFPTINWNQFAKFSEVNHPSDADIAGGHDVFARKYRPGLFEPPEQDLNHPDRRFEHDPQDPDPGQRKLF